MIQGVSEGYKRELKLVGVGYTADANKGNFLLLNLGFSHPIYFEKPICHPCNMQFFVCVQ